MVQLGSDRESTRNLTIVEFLTKQMITWAAILLLRGVEDGMTHQDGRFNSKKRQKSSLIRLQTST
jgi:hypothetical protein